MTHEALEFTSYTMSYFDIGDIEAVQLSAWNFQSVQEWLESLGHNSSCWTNESYVIGLWIYGTWHDHGKKTPVPFGWWVYRTADDRSIGCSSEVSAENHWTRR